MSRSRAEARRRRWQGIQPPTEADLEALARATRLARTTLARSAVEGVGDYMINAQETGLDGYVIFFRTLADAERIAFDLYLFMVGWRLNIEAHRLAIKRGLQLHARKRAWQDAHGGQDFDRREADACAAHGVTPDDMDDLLEQDPPPQWLTDLFEEEETHYQGFPEYAAFDREEEQLCYHARRTLYEQHAPDLLAVAQNADDWRQHWEAGRRIAERVGLWKPQPFNDVSDGESSRPDNGWIYVAGEDGPTVKH